MYRTIGPAARVLATGLAAVLLVALLAGIVPSALGYESFVVSGVQMMPTLAPDDVAVVEPTRAELLSPGDVVTYRTPEDPNWVVTRRVVDMHADGTGRLAVEARSDADGITEQVLVGPSSMVGRLVYRVPRVGMVVNFVNQLWGKLVLLGLPLVLLGLDWLRGRVRRGREQVPGLLSVGRRALRAGHPQLALRAADAALSLDAYNRAARILKQQSLKALQTSPGHAAA